MSTQPSPAKPDAAADPIALQRLLYGYVISRALQVAAQLGVADALGDRTRSAAELAAAVEAQPEPLSRLLRALASVGLLTEAEPGRFALTPTGQLLRSDLPGSLRPLACLYGSQVMLRSYDGLLETVRSGQSACEAIFGQALFPYLSANPADGATFQAAMASVTANDTASLLAVLDFGADRTVVDLGGGQGGLLSAILQANPRLRGVLFDQPAVIEAARGRIDQAGLAARCNLIGGDFFSSVPVGGSTYILKNVLWDWDDERATALLRNCRRAMTSESRVLGIEALIPDGDAFSFNKLVDLNLLVLGGGGRGRSESALRALFEAAGLRVSGVTPTAGRLTVIEGALPL